LAGEAEEQIDRESTVCEITKMLPEVSPKIRELALLASLVNTCVVLFDSATLFCVRELKEQQAKDPCQAEHCLRSKCTDMDTPSNYFVADDLAFVG
jgi:hypothetical protein